VIRSTRVVLTLVASTAFFALAALIAAAAPPSGLTPAGCIGNNAGNGNTGSPGPSRCTGSDGLGQADALAVSPDGKNVYVGSYSNALVVFARSTGGALTSTGCIGNNAGNGNTGEHGPSRCNGSDGLGGVAGVAVSPDGENVYVTSGVSNAVVVFARSANGALTPAGCIANAKYGPSRCNRSDGLNGPRGVAVSPDGKNVYVASAFSNAVVVFARAANGALTPAGCIGNAGNGPSGCSPGHGLEGANSVAVSSDGKNVYVASGSGNAVAVLARSANGALTPAGCIGNRGNGPSDCKTADGLNGPGSVAVSRDGKNVYVTSLFSNSVAEFARAADGALTPAGCIGNNSRCRGADGLGGASSVTVSPDGKNVYVASLFSNAVAAFARNSAGGLIPVGCIGNSTGSGNTGDPGPRGCADSDGLGNAYAIAVSRDGKNVYLASEASNAVVTFARSAVAPPAITNAKVNPARFSARKGTTFSYTLSEPGLLVKFTIERKRAGGYSPAGHFYAQGVAGKNTTRFSGKLGNASLTPATYRATLVAVDPNNLRSQPVRLTFTVTSR
jgi:DNA-binding beta-propeller fold protein YncE